MEIPTTDYCMVDLENKTMCEIGTSCDGMRISKGGEIIHWNSLDVSASRLALCLHLIETHGSDEMKAAALGEDWNRWIRRKPEMAS